MEHWILLGSDWSVAYTLHSRLSSSQKGKHWGAAHRRESIGGSSQKGKHWGAAHRREIIGDVDANIKYVSHSQLLQFREVISHILGAN